MSYYLRVNFDDDFAELLMYLKSKYPEKLFNIDGIGSDQTDLNQFSKDFFNTRGPATDTSIDPNSNVASLDVVTYTVEAAKPIYKLNSYYVLWKKLKQLYGKETAHKIVESQLTGDIYINDMVQLGAGIAYSYYGPTSIVVKINGEEKYTTMKALFNEYLQKGEVEVLSDREQITFKDAEILDENNSWVPLKVLLRHKTNKKLYKLETKNGKCTIVTADHPVILEDGSEKLAEDVKIGDKLKNSSSAVPLSENTDYSIDKAYFLGFLIGDGFVNHGMKDEFWKTNNPLTEETVRRGRFAICQKNATEHKVLKVAQQLFENTRTHGDNRGFVCGYKKDSVEPEFVQILKGAKNKKLPENVLKWKKSALLALLAGLIDSDGCVSKGRERNFPSTGSVSIRVISFALVQQIGEIARALGFKNVRTSTCGSCDGSVTKYYNGLEITSKEDLYRVSFRVAEETKEILQLSEKFAAQSVDLSKSNKDGRWETSEVHKIEEFVNFDEDFVYDVTTGTGHFHCQGLIQHNCFNYSANDVAQMGLPMISKIKSVPPKYLYSFKSQLEQFVIIAANNTAGATGLADLFLVMSMYIDKILKTGRDAHFYFEGWKDLNNPNAPRTEPYNKELFEKAVWDYVKENLVSFIYTINQPMRGGIQSPFTNVSVYDDTFLESLLPSYILIDGNEVYSATKEIAKKLQALFLDSMNEELSRTVYTFPVTTACIALNEDKEPSDPDFVKMVAEKNLQFGFINFYCGKTSTLSSCCFSGKEEVEVFDQQENKHFTTTLKEFIEAQLPEGSIDAVAKRIAERYTIKAPEITSGVVDEVVITGVLRKLNQFSKLYRVAANGKEIFVTPDHEFKVMNRITEEFIDITAQELDPKEHMVPFEENGVLSMVLLDAVEQIYSTDFVYDIELAHTHYFAANGIVSHNCRLRSETDNRFFKEQQVYTIEFNDGSSIDVLSTDAINSSVGPIYPDELKKNLATKEFVIDEKQVISVAVRDEKILNSERQYTNSFGSGSTKIGSIGVATLNLPRLAYRYKGDEEAFFKALVDLAESCCKVNHAKRNIIQKRIDAGVSPLYNHHFAELKKQYSTTGIVGLNECVEIMGYSMLDENGQKFAGKILDVLNKNCDKYERLTKNPHNMEQIPAESAAVKLCKKDKLLKFQTPENSYEIYSNQFIPLISKADLLDRIRLQGMFDGMLSGGAILHINVNEKINDPEQVADIIEYAAKQGVVYFAINYAIKECEDGHIMVKKGCTCTCGKPFAKEYSRPVGYLTCTRSWSKEKREEDYKKRQFYEDVKIAV